MDAKQAVREELAAGSEAALIEVRSIQGRPPSRPGMCLAITRDGRMYGSLGCDGFDRSAARDGERAIASHEAFAATYVWEEESGSLINVEVRPFGRGDGIPDSEVDIIELLVVGSGPVARACVRLGAAMGYHVRVATLPESAVGEFGEADEVIVVRDAADVAALRPGAGTYVVICGHDEKFSQPVLKELAKSEAAYIGMMGSRRHTAHIYSDLEELGISSEQIGRVFTPVGIDIGSETPEEIALSALSQVVAVRRSSSRPR